MGPKDQSGPLLTIWIDNDGCPVMVRDLVFSAGMRFSLRVVVVANSYMRIPAHPLISMQCVRGHFDAADDYIVDHVQSGDLVITSDVPLAGRIVAKGAKGLSTRGEVFDESNIAERLAIRNLMQELRSGGTVSGGPPPLSPQDKKRFADALDRTLAQLRSSGG